MKKKQSIKELRKEVWKVFSTYIRKRDNFICFTCGKPGNEAGHFIHKNSLDFNEININCQCPRCNKWLHGNLGEYGIRLIKKYGIKKVEQLKPEGNRVKKFRREELEEIREKYGS